MTSYDELFQLFIDINKTNPVNIPQEDEKKYNMIHVAVLHYNNRMEDDIEWNDSTELLDRILDDNELLLLAHFLKYSFLENELNYFVSIWSTFQKEMGFKDYLYQLKGKQDLIDREDKNIDQIINNMSEDFM